MVCGGPDSAGLARDTVFAAVIIICNDLVGACLLLGSTRHHEQGFQAQGANAALIDLTIPAQAAVSVCWSSRRR